MKYDDASWHRIDGFPKELPVSASGTHIGMYVTWCLLNGLAGPFILKAFEADLKRMQQKNITPGKWFMETLDEQFTDDVLSDVGNEFTSNYYNNPETGQYYRDYIVVLAANAESIYHIGDTWENYELISPVIGSRYTAWKQNDQQ